MGLVLYPNPQMILKIHWYVLKAFPLAQKSVSITMILELANIEEGNYYTHFTEP